MKKKKKKKSTKRTQNSTKAVPDNFQNSMASYAILLVQRYIFGEIFTKIRIVDFR